MDLIKRFDLSSSGVDRSLAGLSGRSRKPLFGSFGHPLTVAESLSSSSWRAVNGISLKASPTSPLGEVSGDFNWTLMSLLRSLLEERVESAVKVW